MEKLKVLHTFKVHTPSYSTHYEILNQSVKKQRRYNIQNGTLQRKTPGPIF